MKSDKEIPIKNLNSLLDSLEAGVVVHGKDTAITYINNRALKMLRLTEDQAYGRRATDPNWKFINESGDTLPITEYPVNQVLNTGKPVQNMILGILDSTAPEPTWVRVNAFPEQDKNNLLDSVVVSFVDITDSKHSFSFENIVRLSNDTIVVTEADPLDEPGPRIVYVNEAFVDLTGYTPDEVLGKSPRLLQGPETDPEAKSRIEKSIKQGKPIRETLLNYGKSGEKYWIDINIVPLQNYRGEITHFVAIERDVTLFKDRELQLRENANIDPLTGIMNRRGFTEYTEITEANAKRHNRNFSIVAIDIDYFKSINDQYGHDGGDMVLRHIAGLMQKLVRTGDIFGRLGGEEFAIMLPETGLQEATIIAERLRKLIQDSVVSFPDKTSIQVTASFGVATSDNSNFNYNLTLKLADQALYEAKSKGRNQVVSAD